MKKKLPIILVSLIITLFAFLAIAYASGNSLQKNNTNWENFSNTLDSDYQNTYPYNSDTAKKYSVSLDIAFGVKRDLVNYNGELPWAQTHTDDDERFEAFSGYYSEPGTNANINDAAGSGGTVRNPGYGASWVGIETTFDMNTCIIYWGIDNAGDSKYYNFKSLSDAENINNPNVKSLRIFAMANADTSWFKNILYNITKFFAWLGVSIISIIIQVKNVSLDDIMELLHLDSLNKVMTQTFIYDSDTLHISVFAVLCIVMFMIAIAAYAYRYATGKDKVNSLWEILAIAFLGLFLIGVSLTGRITSLGSTMSNLTSGLLYKTTQAFSATDSGEAFTISITDPSHENDIVELCEMSLINKAFIDLQIQTQFGRGDIKISDLSLTKLGDTSDYQYAKQFLSGLPVNSTTDFINRNFNGNLGYYYWFANSSANQKVDRNTSISKTNSLAVTNKLSSMITYLQVLYNKNSGNPNRQETIKRIILGFSNPDSGSGALAMLMLTACLVLLALVLIKYAGCIIIAKLTMFLSLLGIAVAGPLILTTNKKLVKTGEHILGMMVVSILELTVYSILFDLILYIVASMFSPDLIKLIVLIILLILLLKLNPIIAEKVREVLQRTERTIAPGFVQTRQRAKNAMKRKVSQKVNEYDNSQRVVGRDENGNEIYESRKGDAFSRLLHHGANVFAEGSEKQGFLSVNSKIRKDRKANLARTDEKKEHVSEAMHKEQVANATQDVEDTINVIKSEASTRENQLNNEVNEIINETKEKDVNGNETGNYNLDALTDEEKALARERAEEQDKVELLKTSEFYRDVVDTYQRILFVNKELDDIGSTEERGKLTDEEQALYDSYNAQIKAAEDKIAENTKLLDDMIKARAVDKVFDDNDLDLDTAKELYDTDDLDTIIKNTAKQEAQEKYKVELDDALKKKIDLLAEDVNTRSAKKIGAKATELNKAAIEEQAATMRQLDQLMNDELIDDTKDAKANTKQAVDNLYAYYEPSNLHTENTKAAKKEGKDAYKAAQEEIGTNRDLTINESLYGMVVGKPKVDEEIKEEVATESTTDTTDFDTPIYKPDVATKPTDEKPITPEKIATEASTTAAKPMPEAKPVTEFKPIEELADVVEKDNAQTMSEKKPLVLNLHQTNTESTIDETIKDTVNTDEKPVQSNNTQSKSVQPKPVQPNVSPVDTTQKTSTEQRQADIKSVVSNNEQPTTEQPNIAHTQTIVEPTPQKVEPIRVEQPKTDTVKKVDTPIQQTTTTQPNNQPKPQTSQTVRTEEVKQMVNNQNVEPVVEPQVTTEQVIKTEVKQPEVKQPEVKQPTVKQPEVKQATPVQTVRTEEIKNVVNNQSSAPEVDSIIKETVVQENPKPSPTVETNKVEPVKQTVTQEVKQSTVKTEQLKQQEPKTTEQVVKETVNKTKPVQQTVEPTPQKVVEPTPQKVEPQRVNVPKQEEPKIDRPVVEPKKPTDVSSKTPESTQRPIEPTVNNTNNQGTQSVPEGPRMTQDAFEDIEQYNSVSRDEKVKTVKDYEHDEAIRTADLGDKNNGLK